MEVGSERGVEAGVEAGAVGGGTRLRESLDGQHELFAPDRRGGLVHHSSARELSSARKVQLHVGVVGAASVERLEASRALHADAQLADGWRDGTQRHPSEVADRVQPRPAAPARELGLEALGKDFVAAEGVRDAQLFDAQLQFGHLAPQQQLRRGGWGEGSGGAGRRRGGGRVAGGRAGVGRRRVRGGSRLLC